MPTLLDLPEHILINSLGYLDAKSVLSAGVTCRELHAVATGDEVWRLLCLHKYDDPRKAAAFPVSRQRSVEWKKTVMDREAVSSFLKKHKLDGTRYKSVYDLCDTEGGHEAYKTMLKAWAPRIFPTVLGLFLDLPPPGYASANIPILVRFIQGGLLNFLCQAFNTDEANHLETLFNRFQIFWTKERQHFQRSIGKKWVPFFKFDSDSDSDSETRLEGFVVFDSNEALETYLRNKQLKRSPWVYAAAATIFLPPPPDASKTNDLGLQAAFNALRGRALSVLTVSVADPARQVWDWAGVGGSWHGELTRWFTVTRRYAAHWSCDITSLSLEVANCREAVESACPARERTDLWSDFGDVPAPVDGLAPIYFHGACMLDYVRALVHRDPRNRETPGPQSAFVHGVVYLDSKFDPPQVRYTIAITGGDVATQWRRLVYHGIEPWGPCSGAGVFGPYYRSGDDEYGQDPTGFIWLRRI